MLVVSRAGLEPVTHWLKGRQADYDQSRVLYQFTTLPAQPLSLIFQEAGTDEYTWISVIAD